MGCAGLQAAAQDQPSLPDSARTKRVAAGPQYLRPSLHQKLFGRHYRKEWTMPVTVPVLRLDTLYGGLQPYEAGGGRQTRNLHLHGPGGKEWVLRTVDKELGRALPEVYKGTWVESLFNDQVSVSHPYGALIVPP
ncbi:MAG TPA: hypothetical protein VHK69_13855, partial [Chitinophagaceae bacterium]|nr:hypothetical protein [Chitinophagaceae bacterium]